MKLHCVNELNVTTLSLHCTMYQKISSLSINLVLCKLELVRIDLHIEEFCVLSYISKCYVTEFSCYLFTAL